MLVPNTCTTMSVGLGQVDEDKLNIWLQTLDLSQLQDECGISAEPQVFLDAESM